MIVDIRVGAARRRFHQSGNETTAHALACKLRDPEQKHATHDDDEKSQYHGLHHRPCRALLDFLLVERLWYFDLPHLWHLAGSVSDRFIIRRALSARQLIAAVAFKGVFWVEGH